MARDRYGAGMAEDQATREEEAFILGRTPFDTGAIRAFAEPMVDAMRRRPEAASDERPA
jgi:hypothetical protein